MWIEVAKNLGLTGILTAGAVWIFKILIGHLFSKDLEKFKANLEKEIAIHRIRYEKMHSERAEVIKELYKKMSKVHRSFGSFMSPLQLTGEPTEEEKGKLAAQHANEFTEYYEENRIFIEEDLAEDIDQLSKTLRSAWLKFRTSRAVKNESNEHIKYWDDAWKIIDEEVPKLKKEIEKKFRKILGITNGKK